MKSVAKALGVALAGAAALALVGCQKPKDATPAKPTAMATTTAPAAAPAPVAAASMAGGDTVTDANGNVFPKVGTCHETTITGIGPRLDTTPGTNNGPDSSGTSVDYADNSGGVSYDLEPEIVKSKVGDHVKVCVVELPTECPKGDNRGVVYSAVNERTGGTWKLPDSQHSCGGA